MVTSARAFAVSARFGAVRLNSCSSAQFGSVRFSPNLYLHELGKATPLSLTGAAASIIFVATKYVIVTTKYVFVAKKSMLVTTMV